VTVRTAEMLLLLLLLYCTPAVEVEESLGYLKGSLEDKLEPFLFSTFYLMDKIIGKENRKKLQELDIISSLATYFIMLSKFNLTYSKNVWLLFIFTLLSITICLILKTQVSYPFSIYSELVFSSIVILISIFLLNKRINLIEFAIKIMLRIFKK
jgi:hypothetical protein